MLSYGYEAVKKDSSATLWLIQPTPYQYAQVINRMECVCVVLVKPDLPTVARAVIHELATNCVNGTFQLTE